ncbi:MAG: flippase [Bryobacteraceae bacterium]
MRRNVAWNFAGLALPLAVAVAAIPPLVAGLGADRFGVLALAWTLIGYSSLFDLGLGRAVTKLAAEKLARGESPAEMARTALWLLAGLGVVGAVAIAAASPLLVGRVLRIPPALGAESLAAFYWVAAAVPVVTATSCVRGLIEARQRFAAISVVRALVGALTFGAPLAALSISPTLPAMVASIAAVRLVSFFFLLGLAIRGTPDLLVRFRFSRPAASELGRFGGWVTVSNIISPMMVSLDRFLVGALASAASVAYYATPFEIVTKLQVVPSAIVGVLFPAFSASLVRDPARARDLYGRAIVGIAFVLAPLALLMTIFAPEGLTLWLGHEFAARGALAMRILVAGVLVNALAYVPSAFLQASGRPDLNAKLHLAELVPYLVCAVALIRGWGIEGAAAAWTLRAGIDAALLFRQAGRLLPAPNPRPGVLAVA